MKPTNGNANLAPQWLGLPIGWFRWTLACTTPVHLGKVPGAQLRAALGGVLRPFACVTHAPTCEGCRVRYACAYGHLFETIPPPTSGAWKGYENVPRPLVLHHPLGWRATYCARTTFSFDTILLGHAVPHIAHLYYVVKQLQTKGLGFGHKRGKGRFRLVGLDVRTPDGMRPLLDDDGQLVTLTHAHDLSAWWPAEVPANDAVLELQLQTAVRLTYKRQPLKADAFTAHHLINALVHRLELVVRFHGTDPAVLPTDALRAAAQDVEVLERRTYAERYERYSQRQQQRMPLHGVGGSLFVRGPWTTLYPYLRMGELLHVGKGTTMGFGQYRLAPMLG